MIHERRTGRVQHQGFTPIIVMKEQKRRNTLSNCQLESTELNITQNTVKLSNQHNTHTVTANPGFHTNPTPQPMD